MKEAAKVLGLTIFYLGMVGAMYATVLWMGAKAGAL